MPSHDIIDNRQHKLADRITTILSSSEAAHFAVGYFFLSGFEAIAPQLTNVKKLRLLIGNTSNRQTIDQIAQGYRHLELMRDELENDRYPKQTEIDRRCCLLTATPRNKSAWDIYHQLKLFHLDDLTQLPIDPPNLKEFFKAVDNGKKQLPDLLSHILIRRTRSHILRFHGYDADTDEKIDPTNFEPYSTGKKKVYVKVGGKKNFFPSRELETIQYNIEDTYQGIYREIRSYLGAGTQKQKATNRVSEKHRSKSPNPLKKGAKSPKVPLFKGDLGGLTTYDRANKTFKTSPDKLLTEGVAGSGYDLPTAAKAARKLRVIFSSIDYHE